jgi:hypothetical protein
MPDAPAGPEGPRQPALPSKSLEDILALARRIGESDAAAAGPLWGAMHKLLLKAKVSPKEIMPLVAGRDAVGLALLMARLRGEPEPVAPVVAEAASPAAPIDPEVLRQAMRAFRQRLKFTRLDAESRLGVGPMSGGRKHGIDAIIPPREIPAAVWEALAEEGKLRRAGPGFYALAEEAG